MYVIPGPHFAYKESGILCNKPWLTTDGSGGGGYSGTAANLYQSQSIQGFIYANAEDTVTLGKQTWHEYTASSVGLAVTGEVLFYPYWVVDKVVVTDNRATVATDSGSRRYHYDSETGRILSKGRNIGLESHSDNPYINKKRQYIDADDIADSELDQWSVDVTTKQLVKQRVEVKIDRSLPDFTKVKKTDT